MHNLPPTDETALAVSRTLSATIQEKIHKNQGFLPFSDYMNAVLYTPNLGYYRSGSHKIGAGGDFVTAPLISPLFGRTLARQLADLLPQTAGNIYEFGAGTGQLAVDLLSALADHGLEKYYIIEISEDLRERQQALIQQKLPEYANQVIHLSTLPETLNGVMIGNELLDALPCAVVEYAKGQYWQVGVGVDKNDFIEQKQILTGELLTQAKELLPPIEGFRSELHPQHTAFIRTVAERLQRGAMIWIDYGFDAHEYYHPQRNEGTLIGHYRHHTIDNPFYLPGLVDLTAHVNFSGIVQAAVEMGLDLIGYTTQAHFLINNGITDFLSQVGKPDSLAYIQATAACQKLLAEHEMGELFKVMALGKDIDPDWRGFCHGDLCRKL